MGKSVAIIGTRGYPSYYGGFETLVRVLAPYLVEEGWNVTVYGRPGSMREDDPGRDIRVNAQSTFGLEKKSFSTLSYGLTSIVDAAVRKPDVALVMNVANGYWLPILKARGIPTIVNVDGIEWERDKWGRIAKSVFRRGAWFTGKFGDSLVFDSENIASYWSRTFARTGTFIPYGGTVPEDTVAPSFTESGSYVLMVARFVPENTIEEFFGSVEAISKVRDVVIVGSSGYGGEYDQLAEKLAAGSPRVHWLGHVSDDRLLFSLWQHAGAYFHGHSVGGTNPALVQAMACGSPIVARDTVFNREVLGPSGTYVNPNSSEISSKLLEVCGDQVLRGRIAKAGFERQQDVYTWSGVNAAYTYVLESMLNRVG